MGIVKVSERERERERTLTLSRSGHFWRVHEILLGSL